MTGNRVSMTLLASPPSRLEHQIVVDQTGLSGEFQVTLRWTPGSGGVGAVLEDNSTGGSLFAGIQEQLWLKLEARKGPLDAVVIERAEKLPAENR